jgi:hypothetical protein
LRGNKLQSCGDFPTKDQIISPLPWREAQTVSTTAVRFPISSDSPSSPHSDRKMLIDIRSKKICTWTPPDARSEGPDSGLLQSPRCNNARECSCRCHAPISQKCLPPRIPGVSTLSRGHSSASLGQISQAGCDCRGMAEM